LITLFVSGEISQSERTELELLIEQRPEIRDELDDAVAVWNLLGTEEVSFTPQQVFAWQKVEEQIDFEEEDEKVVPMRSKGSRRRTLWVAAAAAIALLASVSVWFMQEPKEPLITEAVVFEPIPIHESKEVVFATTDESKSFYLPDSSLVQLNKNSKLTLHEEFDTGERVIYLEGEAFFDVHHDEERPFVVLTEHTRTKVLGTSFKVRAYPEESRKIVRVESGTVLFRSIDEGVNDSLYLYKSDQGVYDLNISSLVKEPGTPPRLLGERSNREKIIEQEARYPARFLKPNYELKSRVIAPTVVNVEIENAAQYMTYRDVLITIKYTTRQGEKEANYSMQGEVEPGMPITGRFKLKDWFRKSTLLGISIRNAEGFQKN
jgi:ferric-dicitrate binding protein FerR (iron transport regulator)